jgi:hypothetical protein
LGIIASIQVDMTGRMHASDQVAVGEVIADPMVGEFPGPIADECAVFGAVTPEEPDLTVLGVLEEEDGRRARKFDFMGVHFREVHRVAFRFHG